VAVGQTRRRGVPQAGRWIRCSKREPGWGMRSLLGGQDPFYAVGESAPVILFCQPWGLDVLLRLPSVVTFRVTLPLDQVLESFLSPMTLVASDGLDLILFFSFD
jgi:hypothetical protein